MSLFNVSLFVKPNHKWGVELKDPSKGKSCTFVIDSTESSTHVYLRDVYAKISAYVDRDQFIANVQNGFGLKEEQINTLIANNAFSGSAFFAPVRSLPRDILEEKEEDIILEGMRRLGLGPNHPYYPLNARKYLFDLYGVESMKELKARIEFNPLIIS